MSCYLSWQWKQYNGSDIKSGIPRWTESCRMIFKDFVRIINSCIIKKTNSWLAAKWTCFFGVLSPMLQDVPTLYWIVPALLSNISNPHINHITFAKITSYKKTEVHDGLHGCLWTENCIIGSSTTLQKANVNLYSNAFEYDKLSDFQNSLQYFFNWKDRKRQKVVFPVFLINGDAKLASRKALAHLLDESYV